VPDLQVAGLFVPRRDEARPDCLRGHASRVSTINRNRKARKKFPTVRYGIHYLYVWLQISPLPFPVYQWAHLRLRLRSLTLHTDISFYMEKLSHSLLRQRTFPTNHHPPSPQHHSPPLAIVPTLTISITGHFGHHHTLGTIQQQIPWLQTCHVNALNVFLSFVYFSD
jgi:hypothetical protein